MKLYRAHQGAARRSRWEVETPSGRVQRMGQGGHAFMASAETSRNSFAVAPLAD